MAKSAPVPAIVTVSSHSIHLCQAAVPNPIVFNFDPTIVTDLEVVSPRELTAKLRSFLGDHKIRPSNLVVILSADVYFEKHYPSLQPPPPGDLEKFIDTIPFASVSSRLFRFGDGFRQVVVNRDFYESLKLTFESLGFKILGVVPEFSLSSLNVASPLTAQSCRLIQKKLDTFLQHSFTTPSEATVSFHDKEQAFLVKYKILAIIISLMFIAFALVIVPTTLRRRPAPNRQTPVLVTPRPTFPVFASPTPIPATASADLSLFQIRVLNASGIAGTAASMEAKLKAAGFTQTTSGNSSQITSPGTLIVFSPTFPQSARSLLIRLVQDIYPTATSQENDQVQFDVSITIGKQTP